MLIITTKHLHNYRTQTPEINDMLWIIFVGHKQKNKTPIKWQTNQFKSLCVQATMFDAVYNSIQFIFPSCTLTSCSADDSHIKKYKSTCCNLKLRAMMQKIFLWTMGKLNKQMFFFLPPLIVKFPLWKAFQLIFVSFIFFSREIWSHSQEPRNFPTQKYALALHFIYEIMIEHEWRKNLLQRKLIYDLDRATFNLKLKKKEPTRF